MVLQPEEPKVSLSGVHHFARAASEFESPEGVFLFPELRIISTITREVEPEGEGDEDPTVQESLVSEEIVHDLDTCEVTVDGEDLNPAQESLEVDMARLQQKGITVSGSDLGMVFTGVDTMANYEEVLRLLRYRNWHTRSLLDRKFKLVCSELNGRYVSNEFQVEVNVIHTASPMEHASHMAAQPQFVHPERHAFVDLSGHNLASPRPFAAVPSTATVVIVVCVSFLVFMVILGVFRIRAAHQRALRGQDAGKDSEMDWDDSALTITVNPMEVGAAGRPRSSHVARGVSTFLWPACHVMHCRLREGQRGKLRLGDASFKLAPPSRARNAFSVRDSPMGGDQSRASPLVSDEVTCQAPPSSAAPRG
uniref:Calsyntenin 1 n=1 Tax=Suricata suricatta TaxID=37032 RepID=A0A673TCJ7_SURSU